MRIVDDEDGFWKYTATTEELTRWASAGFISPQGIVYYEELSGPNGMDFFLFPSQKHTQKDVADTKRWLRSNRDVTGIIIGHPIGEYPSDTINQI